ncbi:hypothetical protein C8J57DRAFT_1298525 [Mycena rebaudengoi]|nr:hypothetical protein C8J57DRAFT_1298525 [Mycena rebaudengoi]
MLMAASSPSHRPHRRSSSSPTNLPTMSSSSSSHPKTGSKIITSVRRSFSAGRKRDPETPIMPMYSTAAERNPYAPSAFRYPAASRPTVEQIAMGLHLSRTPHLRGAPQNPQRTAIPLPPPPARSSLKKPSPSPRTAPPSTSSTTDVTSTAPSTPRSSDRSSTSLRVRMSRFLPTSRGSSSPSSAVSSPRTSSSDLRPAQKKAVRFTSTVTEED